MELAASDQSEEHAILEAARDGQLDNVKTLLEGNASLIWVKEPETENTLLHLSVDNKHEELARLLLQKGANPDIANGTGWKPLATAARDRSLSLAELLLEHGANLDAINVQVGQSALHVCATTGFHNLAQILLRRGAQVDLADFSGETPLYKAVVERKTDLVKLLLRYGAAKNVRSRQGTTLESLAGEDADMLRLLRSTQVLRGPRITKRPQGQSRKKQTLISRNPAPLGDPQKLVACHAFKATVIDFHIGDTEERVEETIPVYTLLYGRGAEAIMKDARKGQLETKPSFRWYHLPANNVSVEINNLETMLLSRFRWNGLKLWRGDILLNAIRELASTLRLSLLTSG